jgi:DNA-binding winged helix-turn-helix (wHTH) protein
VSDSDRVVVGELEVRPHERAALLHGSEVPLTPREFDIVMMLAGHPGWVFSTSQLSDSPEGEYSPESVSVLVSRLRQKLSAAGASDLIDTVRGIGYRLRATGEPDGLPHPGVNHELRDASWQLQEAVMEMEHSGSPDQQSAAVEMLEQTRRAIFASLSE